ncbi:MAG: trimeric intracellular cation channel family protein [Nocardioides sp.]|nr:trimeric intracellular cation channel family protein [Nocardioides sp.]
MSSAMLLLIIDLLGTFAFALSGGLVAVRKQLDLFGVSVLALTTGMGGGFLRDVLIDATPPAALTNWRYLAVAILAGLLTFAFHPTLGRMERAINLLDAAGLALFCVTGTIKAMDYGLGPVPSALMGMVTGIGGGMIRDLLAGRVPIVFRGDLYAFPALAGASIVAVLNYADQPVWLAAALGGSLCLVWRVVALHRNWQAPMPTGSSSV